MSKKEEEIEDFFKRPEPGKGKKIYISMLREGDNSGNCILEEYADLQGKPYIGILSEEGREEIEDSLRLPEPGKEKKIYISIPIPSEECDAEDCIVEVYIDPQWEAHVGVLSKEKGGEIEAFLKLPKLEKETKIYLSMPSKEGSGEKCIAEIYLDPQGKIHVRTLSKKKGGKKT